MIDRETALTKLSAQLHERFPDAESISTNETANPATPMSCSAEWRTTRGRKVKSVRAHSIQVDPDAFRRYALVQIDEFYTAHVLGRLLPRREKAQ